MLMVMVKRMFMQWLPGGLTFQLSDGSGMQVYII
jgi:hypothetical protein